MTTDIKDCLPECISKFQDDGFAIVDAGLDSGALFELGTLLDAKHPGERNLLDVSAVSQLARSETIHKLVSPLLGDNYFAVRGIFFNKTEEANWKVAWHQDCVIPVAGRRDIPGWGPWSVKAGVHHVRPASDVMSRMLAVRIHLDDCNADSGPLRVVPRSHKHGFLSDPSCLRLGGVLCYYQYEPACVPSKSQSGWAYIVTGRHSS